MSYDTHRRYKTVAELEKEFWKELEGVGNRSDVERLALWQDIYNKDWKPQKAQIDARLKEARSLVAKDKKRKLPVDREERAQRQRLMEENLRNVEYYEKEVANGDQLTGWFKAETRVMRQAKKTVKTKISSFQPKKNDVFVLDFPTNQ